MDKLDFSGIEVSAEELVVALQREGKRKDLKTFPNTAAGHQALIRHLSCPGRTVRAVLESTGLYGLDLALALRRAGIEVMVANPRAVRHFAEALMQRSKNDRLDAWVLVEFAARMPFQPWQPPSTPALHLHALARRLQALTEMQVAEKCRLEATRATETTPPILRRDLERSLRSQRRALARLSGEALKIIRQDTWLNLRLELLVSVHGSIATTSAIQILAELAVLTPDLDVRQWVAYAGLDPRECSSGSSLHKKARISKAGNAHLRRALFMPALVAIRHQPHLRAFYQHLCAQGKPKMVALTAVMRKLLHAIYGMFKHQKPFDGSKIYRLPEPPISTGVAA
ncbi:MAG: IS110 family transposase [Terracidiphilus sp.]